MIENKSRITQETNFKNKSEVNETFIKQVNYLQKILGNKEVESLMDKGILNRDPFLTPSLKIEEGIIKSEKKKEEYEEEQIKIDREALMEGIEQILAEKKEEADALMERSLGVPVYVNVTTHLVFAEIPGEKPSLFYHYTDLVDVNLSYSNINREEQPRKTKRGKKLPVLFSFKYQPAEEVLAKGMDNEPEEKTEKEKKPGKTKFSLKGKKERTKKIEKEDSGMTLFTTKEKGKEE
ncbi:MAG: hypothetical protein JXB88_04715 [Spirochaetales bacterium]|nr:hypothetical protein [Spirochaetales bacterium]